MGMKKRIPEAILLLIVSLVLCQFHWTGTLSFEFSFFTSIAVFLIILPSAMIRLGPNMSGSQKYLELRSYFVLLAIPLITVLLYAFKYGICDLAFGLSWFMLLPTVTMIYSVACAIFAHSVPKTKKWMRWLLALAPTLVFSILNIWDLYVDPQISFYHPVIGYFPGPMYDEWIPLFGALVTYRLWIILFSVWVILKSTIEEKNWYLLAIVLAPLLFRSNLGWHYSHKDIRRKLGSHMTTKYTDLYFSGLNAVSMNNFARSLDFYVEHISEKLDLQPPKEKIRVYIYKYPSLKKQLTGTDDTFVGNPMQNALHLLPTNISDTILVHEFAHVVAAPMGIPILKISPKIGLLEGLATALQTSQMNLSPHEWSKAMMDESQLPNLTDGLNAISFWKDNPTRVYLASGSFVQWLIDTQGIEKFKKVYKGDAFESVYSKPLSDLLEDWKKFLKGIEVDASSKDMVVYFLSRKPFYKKKCVHEVAHWGMKFSKCNKSQNDCTPYINRACELDPENPSLLLRRARYLFRSEQLFRMDTTLIPLPSPENPRVQNNIIQLFNDDMHKIRDANFQYELSNYEQPSFEFTNTIMARIYISKHSDEVLKGILLGDYIPDPKLTWPKGALYNHAMLYFARLASNAGEYGKALIFLQRINPKQENKDFNVSYWEVFAEVNEGISHYKDAVDSYKKLIELSPHQGTKAFSQLQIDRLNHVLKNLGQEF